MAARSIAASLALVFIAAGCGTKSETRSSSPRHVILISVDTLRSDRLPAYGYRGVETPNIDALRRDSILFERAYSHCPLTAPSHATVFTGELPAENGIRDNSGYTLTKGMKTLAELMRERGYETGAAVSAHVLKRGNGLERGFAFYEDAMEREASGDGFALRTVQRDGAETIAAAQPWIASNATKKIFFFLHLYEPHSPYSPPEPYASRYTPYDGEIARTDDLIGTFIGDLKARGIYDDALIVFFSDHGEGLNDHGEDEHGIFLYREAVQVPLFVKLPKGERGGTSVFATAGLSDIFPTVIDAIGDRSSQPLRSGARPLLSLTSESRQIYSETFFPRFHFGWSDLHSLTDGTHHYIHAPQPELYDLRNDFAERRNVLADERRTYAAMRNAIEPLVKQAEAPAPISPEEAAKLAALGYLGGSSVPAGGDLPDPKTKVETFRAIREAFRKLRGGDYLTALSFYEKLLRENPRMLDLWDVRARILVRLGRVDEAIASAKEGLKVSPQATHLAVLIGTLSADSGKLEQAQQHAELALQRHPGEANEILARVALARRDFERAEEAARAAIASGDDRVRSLIILGRVETERGNHEAAIKALDEAASLAASKKMDVTGLHFMRGDALARLGREGEAEAAFREEIRRFPEDPKPYSNLILLLVAAGRVQEATQLIHDLEKASPTPPAYATISRTLRVVGDERGARFWARRGLQRYPGDRTLTAMLGG